MGLVIGINVFLRHPVFPETAGEGEQQDENYNRWQDPEHEAS
jgi:hypothetical protein